MTSNTVSTPSLLLQHGYRYIELIGEGSNGKTYKSQNLKTGEIVAVKALKFSDNLKNYELFKREADTLKSLQTPGTPVFYDYIVGEGEFTECWLVQEYIQGESILDKLDKGNRFNEDQTLDILLEVAKTVHILQTQYAPPIIHRDIKPSNILVRNEAKNGSNLCLIDFGAVANPQKRGLNSTVAGTVGYMAPEQLIGDCTIQSDYYALGATALHMLTGTNPTEFTSDGFSIQYEKQLKASIPTIHKQTLELLQRLLATNPTERPKDANELIKLIYQARFRLDPAKRKKQARGVMVCKILGSLATFSALLLIALSMFDKVHIAFTWIPLILAPICGILCRSLKNDLSKLPNDIDCEMDLKDIVLTDDNDTAPTDRLEATGEIVRITDTVIEYIIYVDNKHHTCFYRNSLNHPYKVGDKIKVQYRKKFYLFHLCSDSKFKILKTEYSIISAIKPCQ